MSALFGAALIAFALQMSSAEDLAYMSEMHADVPMLVGVPSHGAVSGVVALFHGCAQSAYSFFEHHPQHKLVVRHLLSEQFVVIALSSTRAQLARRQQQDIMPGSRRNW